MKEYPLILSKKEAEQATRIAETRGISMEEAAQLTMKASFAHMVKKNTGKTPARVYDIKQRKKEKP